MAMSEVQKAQNKAATSVRKRAHSQRYRLLCAAVAAAEAAPDIAGARKEADAEQEKSEAASKTRDAHISGLRAQIFEIEAQIETAKNDPTALDARAAERMAWNRWHTLKVARVAEAEALFPDLAGDALWSSAAWEPPKETLDAMSAARAAVYAA